MSGSSRRVNTYPPGTLAGFYFRYSGENQRDASIADQERVCFADSDRQGWKVACVFSDRALTGSSAHRPGYSSLLDGVSRRLFQVIMAESIDRPSRDQEDLAALYKRCKYAGIGIYTLAEG